MIDTTRRIMRYKSKYTHRCTSKKIDIFARLTTTTECPRNANSGTPHSSNEAKKSYEQKIGRVIIREHAGRDEYFVRVKIDSHTREHEKWNTKQRCSWTHRILFSKIRKIRTKELSFRIHFFSEHFFPNTISQTVSRFSHTITSKSGTTGLQFIRGLCDPSGSRKK